MIGCSRQGGMVQKPASLLADGWNDYRTGEFDHAVKSFNEVVEQTSESDENHQKGLYALATTWNLRRSGEDLARAEKLYRKIIAQWPKSDLAAWSLLALARMKHLPPVEVEPDWEAVRKAYQEVMDRFPGHPAAEEAFIFQQETRIISFREEESRRAISELEKFIQDHPHSGFIASAWFLVSRGYHTLRQPEKRLQALIQELDHTEMDPHSPTAERSGNYWAIASIAEFEAGDFETARKYYQRLMDEYPNDQRVYSVKLALKRMDKMEAEIRAEHEISKSQPIKSKQNPMN